MDQEKQSKVCPEFEAVLEDYILDELRADERARVSAHLNACSDCASAVEAAAASRPLLQSVGSGEEPGPYFAARVAALIRAEQERAAAGGNLWSPLKVFALRAAWASAATIALLLGYGMYSTPLPQANPEPNVALVQHADGAGLFSEPATAPLTRDDVLLTITEGDHGK